MAHNRIRWEKTESDEHKNLNFQNFTLEWFTPYIWAIWYGACYMVLSLYVAMNILNDPSLNHLR